MIELLAQLAPIGPRHVAVALFADGGPWFWLLHSDTMAANAARVARQLTDEPEVLLSCAHQAMRKLVAPKTAIDGFLYGCAEIVLAEAWAAAKEEIARVHGNERTAILLLRAGRGDNLALSVFATEAPGSLESYMRNPRAPSPPLGDWWSAV